MLTASHQISSRLSGVGSPLTVASTSPISPSTDAVLSQALSLLSISRAQMDRSLSPTQNFHLGVTAATESKDLKVFHLRVIPASKWRIGGFPVDLKTALFNMIPWDPDGAAVTYINELATLFNNSKRPLSVDALSHEHATEIAVRLISGCKSKNTQIREASCYYLGRLLSKREGAGIVNSDNESLSIQERANIIIELFTEFCSTGLKEELCKLAGEFKGGAYKLDAHCAKTVVLEMVQSTSV